MTPKAQNAAIAATFGLLPQWTLMKRGYYYRVNAQGYTDQFSEAWKVTEAVAKEHANPHDTPVTMHPVPLPDYCGDLNEIHGAVDQLCRGMPDIVQSRSNQDLFQEQLDLLSKWWQVPSYLLDAPQFAEAFLKTVGRWDDSL